MEASPTPTRLPRRCDKFGEKMKVIVEELPESRKQIRVELEQEEVNKYFDDSINQFARTAQIPGFRKGKVPPSILEMKMGKGLQAEVLEKVVSKSYKKACEDEKIVPISAPSVDTGGTMPEKNKPYTFKVTVDVRPAVKLAEYKNMVLEKEKVEITDEQVDAVLQQEREQRAELLPVTDRPAMRGDWVVLEGESLLDGNVVQDFSDRLFQVGSGSLPQELDEALAGMSAGEEKKVNSETERGEKISYSVTVKEIKEKRLLIVDDEFARDIGGFQTLDELRTDIRKNLVAFADMRVKEDLRRQALDRLAGSVEVKLPPALIEEQIERIRSVSRLRVRDETEEPDAEKLKELAVRKLKEYFVLDEIANREKITVPDEELEEIKAKISEGRKSAEEPDMENMRMNLLHRKVLDFLLSHAEIRDKEESLIVKP